MRPAGAQTGLTQLVLGSPSSSHGQPCPNAWLIGECGCPDLPAACPCCLQYFAEPKDQLGYNQEFPSVYCWHMPHIVHAAVAVIRSVPRLRPCQLPSCVACTRPCMTLFDPCMFSTAAAGPSSPLPPCSLQECKRSSFIHPADLPAASSCLSPWRASSPLVCRRICCSKCVCAESTHSTPCHPACRRDGGELGHNIARAHCCTAAVPQLYRSCSTCPLACTHMHCCARSSTLRHATLWPSCTRALRRGPSL
jgi:hypothetical protein